MFSLCNSATRLSYSCPSSVTGLRCVVRNKKYRFCTCTCTSACVKPLQFISFCSFHIGIEKSYHSRCETVLKSMVRLTQNQRNDAVRMLLNGTTQSAVARALQVNRSTISRLYARIRQTGTSADRPRSGRPRVTTPRQDRYIRLTHLRHRFRTATETARNTPGTHNNRISKGTVLSRLREHAIKPYRPYIGLLLTRQRRHVRMEWLHQHRPNVFPMRRWKRTLFTDESRFLLYRSDRRQRVFRRKGERYSNDCVLECDRFGGGGIMVWGGISFGKKTPLIVIDGTLTAQKYCDNVLQPVVVPFVRENDVVLQQDNARPHVARLAMDYLTTNNVEVMNWPPYSPDLNPIEHMWDNLDRRIRKRQNPPSNHQQLRQALLEEWENVTIPQVNRLITSMTKRVRSALAADGGHTRY